jgi:hypothetical protein
LKLAILGGKYGERGVLVNRELVGREKRDVESTRVLVGVSGSALYLRTNNEDGRFIGELSHELLLLSSWTEVAAVDGAVVENCEFRELRGELSSASLSSCSWIGWRALESFRERAVGKTCCARRKNCSASARVPGNNGDRLDMLRAWVSYASPAKKLRNT